MKTLIAVILALTAAIPASAQKIETYTAVTAPASTDLLLMAVDVSGTFRTRKITLGNLGTRLGSLSLLEAHLGNPGTSGFVLSSTTGGVRSWVANGAAFSDSAGLRGLLSDETGTGFAVFATSPTLTTPILGVAASTSLSISSAVSYDATTWNGSLLVPSRDEVRDAFELATVLVADIGADYVPYFRDSDGSIQNQTLSAGETLTAGVHALKETFIIACSDLTTPIMTGTSKAYFRAPYACTVTAVRASVLTASSSGLPTIDINDSGTTILSTKLTIDATEKTSVTAATAAVISDTALAADAEITFDFDVAGTGAAGVIVQIDVTR